MDEYKQLIKKIKTEKLSKNDLSGEELFILSCQHIDDNCMQMLSGFDSNSLKAVTISPICKDTLIKMVDKNDYKSNLNTILFDLTIFAQECMNLSIDNKTNNTDQTNYLRQLKLDIFNIEEKGISKQIQLEEKTMIAVLAFKKKHQIKTVCSSINFLIINKLLN